MRASSSPIRSSRSRIASNWRSGISFASMLRNLARRDQLVAAADDGDVVAQTLERSRSHLDHVDAPGCPELRERHPCELRRSIREDRKPDSLALESQQGLADVRGGPEVD